MKSWSVPAVPDLPATASQGAPVLVTNDVTGQLAPAARPGQRHAGIYVCGITPYDATHLGHAATYVAFDLLVRAWRDAGLTVTYASNVTDVDDPLLERATQRGLDWRALAVEQTELFRSDMSALRVIPPDVYRGAVETIPEVVEAVEHLLAAGAAYQPGGVPESDGALVAADEPACGDVYAAVHADPLFARDVRLGPEGLVEEFAAHGGDPQRPGKRDPLDPLLWREERLGEPAWPGGALAPGRPGWHIECAAIALGALGVRYDVLGGGRDLIFPHHEMSTSHARMLTGDAEAGPSVRVHSGMVGYQGEKMSKSLGNLVLVSELVKAGHEPGAIRLALLSHHYRADWEWHDSDLADATSRLAAWRHAVAASSQHPDDAAGLTVLDALRRALANDLDSPTALGVVDRWASQAAAGQAGGSAVVAAGVDALLGVDLSGAAPSVRSAEPR